MDAVGIDAAASWTTRCANINGASAPRSCFEAIALQKQPGISRLGMRLPSTSLQGLAACSLQYKDRSGGRTRL